MINVERSLDQVYSRAHHKDRRNYMYMACNNLTSHSKYANAIYCNPLTKTCNYRVKKISWTKFPKSLGDKAPFSRKILQVTSTITFLVLLQGWALSTNAHGWGSVQEIFWQPKNISSASLKYRTYLPVCACSKCPPGLS